MGRVCGCGTFEFHNAGVTFQKSLQKTAGDYFRPFAEWGQIQFLFLTMFAVCLVVLWWSGAWRQCEGAAERGRSVGGGRVGGRGQHSHCNQVQTLSTSPNPEAEEMGDLVPCFISTSAAQPSPAQPSQSASTPSKQQKEVPFFISFMRPFPQQNRTGIMRRPKIASLFTTKSSVVSTVVWKKTNTKTTCSSI